MATNAEVIAHIEKLAPLAIAEASRRAKAGQGYVVPSICIAQSAHETNWGTAPIMVRANAFFGIKAGGSWTGKIYTADTFEVVDGVQYNTVANFRAYDSLEESVADYYNLIVNNSRYSAGVSYYGNQLSAYDTIYAIWSGGYATDPPYVQMIMDIVNGRDLTQYDSKVDPEGATAPSYPYNPPSGGGSGTITGNVTNPIRFKFFKI